MGDFNGHNVIWGSDDVNERGRIIENFINKNNLCLFNDNKPTYLHPATGIYTSLDLSICYPTLDLDYEWKVHDDLCGKRQIAEKTIPKTSTKTKKKTKPWFNDDCKTSIQKRRQALRQFNTRPMHRNLENFRVFRAKARGTIRDSKRKSWKQYVSKLNSRTSIKKVWDMVRKIQGKGKSASVNHLKKNNTHVTSKKDIANTLADNFSEKSSSENYSVKFRKIKDQQEKQKLKFTSDNTESYKSKFSLKELTDALSKAHDSSSGPDDIHYQL